MNHRAVFEGVQVGQALSGLTKLRPNTQQLRDIRYSIRRAHQVSSIGVGLFILGQVCGNVTSIAEVHNNRICPLNENGAKQLHDILMVGCCPLLKAGRNDG